MRHHSSAWSRWREFFCRTKPTNPLSLTVSAVLVSLAQSSIGSRIDLQPGKQNKRNKRKAGHMNLEQLHAAEQALASATTSEQVSAAHALLKAAIAQRRRSFKREYGPLAQSFIAAMQFWDRQKTEGVSLETRVAGLEKTLRAAWPFTREWKLLCARCGDTGWAESTCTPATPCDGWSTYSYAWNTPMHIKRRLCTLDGSSHSYIS